MRGSNVADGASLNEKNLELPTESRQAKYYNIVNSGSGVGKQGKITSTTGLGSLIDAEKGKEFKNERIKYLKQVALKMTNLLLSQKSFL